MDGDIGVTGNEHEGSTFWFTLVLGAGVDIDVASSHMDLEGLNALIVDDRPENNEIVSEQLASVGVKTTACDTPQQARALMAKRGTGAAGFQLVITDYMMEGLDGLQLAAEITKTCGADKPPILLLTSADNAGDTESFLAHGVNGLITKPVRQSQLLDVAATIVSARHQKNCNELVTAFWNPQVSK